jgi:hypothetical protein
VALSRPSAAALCLCIPRRGAAARRGRHTRQVPSRARGERERRRCGQAGPAACARRGISRPLS